MHLSMPGRPAPHAGAPCAPCHLRAPPPPAGCPQVFFERANHWLYLEQPKEFCSLLADFALRGFAKVAQVLHVP